MDEFKEDISPEEFEYERQDQPTRHTRRTLPKHAYYLMIGAFAAVFLFCAVYLGIYLWNSYHAESMYDDLESLRDQAAATMPNDPTQGGSTNPSQGEDGGNSSKPQSPQILPELKPIYDLNSDLVGYLDFPYEGLNLSYPVLQRKGDPAFSDYYLTHDFYGNESQSGCPYVPFWYDVFKPSDNIVICGHNMKTGGMFNKLTYYQDKAYWENHQTFRFDTLYERRTYQIFAVFKTAGRLYTEDGGNWGYPFHRYNDFPSEEEFNQYIAEVKGAAFENGEYQGYSFYDTGITPEYGDELLCVYTCEYTMKEPDGISTNGRFVVMAVRID